MRFLLSINYFVWLLISAVFFAAGEFLSKKFALQPKFVFIFWVLVVDGIGTLAWLPAILAKQQLSIVGSLWSVLSLLLTVMIGLLVFHEKLSGLGAAGIVAAFVAVFLLSLSLY